MVQLPALNRDSIADEYDAVRPAHSHEGIFFASHDCFLIGRNFLGTDDIDANVDGYGLGSRMNSLICS